DHEYRGTGRGALQRRSGQQGGRGRTDRDRDGACATCDPAEAVLMGARRQSREIALQALYRIEVTGDSSTAALDHPLHNYEAPIEARGYALELIDGVNAEREAIDRMLAAATEHWSLGRLSRVDLNVLRIAAYELRRRDERVPTSVV